MSEAVTFTISNASIVHQITLDRDSANSSTIIVWVDGSEHHLDDARARKDGKALVGGGLTILIAQTTITVMQYGHVMFSGIVTDDVSRRIIRFIVSCGLLPI
jgi:hypothetical protein